MSPDPKSFPEQMMALAILWGFLCVSALAQVGAEARELTDPDGDTMGWVYFHWAGMDPPLRDAAERNVQTMAQLKGTFNGEPVNELNRDNVVAAETARLQEHFNAARGVKTIVMNISGVLSDYDPGYGEFYIDSFAPGGTVGFGAFVTSYYQGGPGLESFQIQLKLTNALEAYVWKVPPEEAARIIETFEAERTPTNSYQTRYIYARTRIELLDATPSNDDRREMTGKILSFALHTRLGTLLYEADLTD